MNQNRPNILFIMSDDHASHAISCYGSRINETPHIDRIANEGMMLNNCFCTNSICTPSRASIMTGTYNHINTVRLLPDPLPLDSDTFARQLHGSGYQTAVFGKWHLHTEPQGFDDYKILPNQGLYHNPYFISSKDGYDWDAHAKDQHNEKHGTVYDGYATDLITDFTLDWIRNCDRDRPFLAMCHHKAPHRYWEPDETHAHMYEDVTIPEPPTLFDDYANRASPAEAALMRVGEHMRPQDVKRPIPDDLTGNDLRRWAYQHYIKDYLRCVASVDDNVGRLLDYLDEEGLAENTLVIYTSDQGFFLGDHGWYDKRFMYEESLRMPFVARYPKEIRPKTVSDDIVLNVDFPALFLELAGESIPEHYQGRSFRRILRGEDVADWRQSMYYRYWAHGGHGVCSHYGVRTLEHKLICYYGNISQDTPEPEWELFDLNEDPYELCSVYNEPAYADTVAALKRELHSLQETLGDQPAHTQSETIEDTTPT